jgi:hypothetical protein
MIGMRSTATLSLLAGLAFTIGGCATARMAAPPDIAGGSDVLTVSDRSRASGLFVNEGFKLGKYQVADVDRKWNKSSSTGVGPWSKETKTTGFTYALVAQDKKLAGQCSSEASSHGIRGFSWGSIKIACTCEGDGGKAELLMVDDGRSLTVDGKAYKVEPIHAVQGGSSQSDPTGFRADGEAPLGAVEVLHPGQVWLTKGLDEATAYKTTCTFVGLMLYKPPQD